MKTPSIGAVVMGLIPFAAMCFSAPVWDRVEPTVLGIPFNLFWLIVWVPLTSVCLRVAYRLEMSRIESRPGVREDGEQ